MRGEYKEQLSRYSTSQFCLALSSSGTAHIRRRLARFAALGIGLRLVSPREHLPRAPPPHKSAASIAAAQLPRRISALL